MIEFIQANGWVVDFALMVFGFVLGFLFRGSMAAGGFIERRSHNDLRDYLKYSKPGEEIE